MSSCALMWKENLTIGLGGILTVEVILSKTPTLTAPAELAVDSAVGV